MNLRYTNYIPIFFMLSFCFINKVKTQDVHYSQFHNVPLYQSPAQTGLIHGDYRFTGVYRSQWESVPVQYKTFAAGFDMKSIETKDGVLGTGLILTRDQAGDSDLSLTTIMLSVAYTLKLTKRFLMTTGFSAGVAQRSLDYTRLTFDNQFNGDQFVPGSSTGENMEDTKNFYIDLAAGMNYRFQVDKRTKLDVGVSGFHFNKPNQAFDTDDEISLPMRLFVYMNGSFKLNTKSDFLIRGFAQKQFSYEEFMFGGGWRYHLSNKRNKETSIALSTHYRLRDAVIPMLEIEYGSWKGGFSYDINISDFNIATNNRGGPEITLQYIITKVKPLPEYRACPVF